MRNIDGKSVRNIIFHVDVKVEVYSNELNDNFHKMAFISKEAESIIVKSSACGQDE